MKEITLEGSYHQIGAQYGRAFRKEIKRFVFFTRLMAAAAEGDDRDFFRPKPHHLAAALMKNAAFKKQYRRVGEEFVTNIERYHPDALEMFNGMAETTGIDRRDIVFMNCMLEYSLKCSDFVAVGRYTESGAPLVAMNSDESKDVQPYETTLRIKPDTGHAYTASFMAGMVMPNFGMNETGLALAGQILFLDNPGAENTRIPHLAKMSVINRAATVEEARDILAEVPPSGIGASMIVADSHQVLVREDNSVIKHTEVFDDGYHCNGNYPMFDELQPYVQIDKRADSDFFYAKNRHRKLQEFAANHAGSIDMERLHGLLSDHGTEDDDSLHKSICVHPEHTRGIKTCASFLASPAERTMRIYDGNPCENRYEQYTW